MVFDETLADGIEKVPVQAGVYKADDDFGHAVPIVVDGNIASRQWIASVC